MADINRWIIMSLLVLTPIQGQFKKVLTNEDLIAMAKSGIGDPGLLRAIEENTAQFDISSDALITLKGAGLSEGIMLALLSAAGRNAVESAAGPGADVPPSDVGVYVIRNNQRVALRPESFKWKEPDIGGWLTRFDKVVNKIPLAKTEEKDEHNVYAMAEQLNGSVPGTNSSQVVAPASEFLVVCSDAENAQEYRLVRMQRKSKRRDFSAFLFFLLDNVYRGRSVFAAGVVFGWDGNHPAQMIDFEAEQASTRTYKIKVPDLKAGHYAFLAPGMPVGGAEGTVYTFEIH
jgi:hypothetical protein